MGAGVTYTLKIHTKKFGKMTLVDDSTKRNHQQSKGPTGKHHSSGAGAGQGSNSLTIGNGGDTQISVSNSLTPTAFTVPQTFIPDLSGTGSAPSPTTSLTIGGDQAALALGISGTVNAASGTTAGDYPGNPTSQPTCTTLLTLGACGEGGVADAHFVTVLVTVASAPGAAVPAPASLLLLGASMVTAGGVAWRRRRAQR